MPLNPRQLAAWKAMAGKMDLAPTEIVRALIAEIEQLTLEREHLECSNCHAPIASWGHHPKCGHAGP